MTQITTDTSREFARKQLEEGLSNDTVNGWLRLLWRMLNIAHEDEKISVVRRELAQKNPDTYLFYVATSLNNLGILDREQNRMDEARQAYDDALKIWPTTRH